MLDGTGSTTYESISSDVGWFKRCTSVKFEQFVLGKRLAELFATTNKVESSYSVVPQTFSFGCVPRMLEKLLGLWIIRARIKLYVNELAFVLDDRPRVGHGEIDWDGAMMWYHASGRNPPFSAPKKSE